MLPSLFTPRLAAEYIARQQALAARAAALKAYRWGALACTGLLLLLFSYQLATKAERRAAGPRVTVAAQASQSSPLWPLLSPTK